MVEVPSPRTADGPLDCPQRALPQPVGVCRLAHCSRASLAAGQTQRTCNPRTRARCLQPRCSSAPPVLWVAQSQLLPVEKGPCLPPTNLPHFFIDSLEITVVLVRGGQMLPIRPRLICGQHTPSPSHSIPTSNFAHLGHPVSHPPPKASGGFLLNPTHRESLLPPSWGGSGGPQGHYQGRGQR